MIFEQISVGEGNMLSTKKGCIAVAMVLGNF